jgi:hypothetical protein
MTTIVLVITTVYHGNTLKYHYEYVGFGGMRGLLSLLGHSKQHLHKPDRASRRQAAFF